MSEPQNDIGAVYDALRCDLIQLLMEYRSQGRFTRAAKGTEQARALFLTELTRSIADILVTAYPKTDANAYAAALADAQTLASSVIDRGLLTSLNNPAKNS
jgi:hypothetical protein